MLRAFFVGLSENPSLRNFAERSALGRRVSGRFVAGTQIADAVRATEAINRAGMGVSIDNLGENVTNPDEARQSAELYHQILDAIVGRQLNANISLKLTHMGLDVDQKLARELVSGLVAKAASLNPPGFVRVDMEGSPYTQRTLDFVHELHRMPGNANSVGTVIQSYLRRSEDDVTKLLAEGIRIRLCKGAYKEPADIAFAEKSEVDANYVKLMKILMKSGVYPRTTKISYCRPRLSPQPKSSPAIPSSSRCFMASDATCSKDWFAMAGASAFTFPLVQNGTPTLCVDWASGPRMFYSLRATCCVLDSPWHDRGKVIRKRRELVLCAAVNDLSFLSLAQRWKTQSHPKRRARQTHRM
jgi:proline dehydrogenase